MQCQTTGDRQRKAHKKSRFGCVFCKKRHIKVGALCDEAFPRCGNCTKFNKDCSLATSNDFAATKALAGPTNALTPGAHSSLPMPTLELLHHCAVGMYESGPVVLPQEMDTIKMGFAHPFYSAIVIGRPQAMNPSKSNIMPVLTFASVTALAAHAQPLYQPRDKSASLDILDDLCNAYRLGRGIRTLIFENLQLLDLSASTPSQGLPSDEEERMKLSLDSDYPIFLPLRTFLHHHCKPEDLSHCLEATQRLFLYMAMLEQYPLLHPNFQLVHQWPIDVDERVVEIISARQSVGLVLMSYYAALMKLRSDVWPMHQWPMLIMEQVERVIAPQFKVFIQWPKVRVCTTG
ncbi:hypothetical protein D6D00_07638 [Aureobasidium pullulans]|nr:hypothetical protein D6D00_07638 [Aureobasidium pullulans]